MVEEVVEQHREEKSESKSEQRNVETNAERQVETETEEEQQEMKSVPDSGTRPGKPGQSEANSMPPPSRAPPSNADVIQLMPPPPLPSRFQGKTPDNPLADPVVHFVGPV